jgi:hypothetical protein
VLARQTLAQNGRHANVSRARFFVQKARTACFSVG